MRNRGTESAPNAQAERARNRQCDLVGCVLDQLVSHGTACTTLGTTAITIRASDTIIVISHVAMMAIGV